MSHRMLKGSNVSAHRMLKGSSVSANVAIIIFRQMSLGVSEPLYILEGSVSGRLGGVW